MLLHPSCIEYVPMAPGEVPEVGEESSGKVFKAVLGIAAAIIIPFAAPAIASAIGLSSAIGASLASTVVGGVLGVASAYASGQRGIGLLLSAAGGAYGGYSGAANAASKVAGTATSAGKMATVNGVTQADEIVVPGIVKTTSALPGVAGVAVGTTGILDPNNPEAAVAPSTSGSAPATPVSPVTAPNVATPGVAGLKASSPGVGTVAQAASAGAAEAGAKSTSLLSRVTGVGRQILDRVGPQRLLAAVTNAAVNNQQIAGLEQVIEARRAELTQLQAADQAAYNEQIAAARQMMSIAEREDPSYWGRLLANDYQVSANREAEQAMRDEAAMRPYDAGKQREDARRNRVRTAEYKSAVYNRGYSDAKTRQNSAFAAAAAGLRIPVPNAYSRERADNDLALEQARNQALTSNVAGLVAPFTDRPNDYPRRTQQPVFPVG